MSVEKFGASYFQKLRYAIYVFAALGLTLTFFSAAHIFSANIDDFSVTFPEFLKNVLPYTGAGVLVLAALSCMLPITPFGFVIALFSSLHVLLFLQGNFFVWKGGILDGNDPLWLQHLTRSLLEISLWGAVLVAAVSLARDFTKYFLEASYIVLFAQIVGFLYLSSTTPRLWMAQYEVPRAENRYVLSSEKNIFVILLDALQSSTVNELFNESPQLRKNYQGFTFFPEHLGAYKSTYASVPAILAGTIYKNDSTLSEYLKKSLPKTSLPQILVDNGYRNLITTLPYYFEHLPRTECMSILMAASESSVRAMREVARVLDLILFRAAPSVLKLQVFNKGKWLVQPLLFSFSTRGIDPWHSQSLEIAENFNAFATVGSEKPTFHFIHLLLPHKPLELDANCEKNSDRFVSEKIAYKNQAACALRTADVILNKLKALKVYDSSLVLIVSDHGFGIPYGTDEKEGPFSLFQRVFPTLLIKPPHSTGDLKINHEKTWITDIPKTIASVMKIKTDLPGHSAFEKIPEDRKRFFYYFEDINHRSWVDLYLPPLEEYEIVGSAHDLKNWKKIQTFSPPID